MASDALYLLFWKPQVGMPVALAQFDQATAAVSRLAELVTARTTDGDWRVVPLSQQPGEAQREALLRNTLGQIESYYISEHRLAHRHRAAAGAA